MLDIGGQLCTRTCMITIDLVMHVKEQEDWQFKVLQSWSQVSCFEIPQIIFCYFDFLSIEHGILL